MTEKDKPFATLDDINAIVLISDASGSIVFANKAIKTILGYTPDEVLGDGWWKLTSAEDDFNIRKAKIASMATGKTDLKDRHLFESLITSKDNREVWTQWTNTLTADGLLVGIAQDITEKKILEEQLIKKNHENELLIKEIHHRVKNNLQIISSILNLQFNNIDDEHVHEALVKSKNRINSISIIHTMLCQSEGPASANFGEYLCKLTESISYGFSLNSNIKCYVEQSQTFFDVDLSINLGLIVTELLTNAYKHAFKGRAEGIIHVKLSDKEGKYELIIADDGVGIAKNQTINHSLGLEIVYDLVAQINGTINLTSENGFKYTITFNR